MVNYRYSIAMENPAKPPPLATILKVDKDLKLALGQGREGNDANRLRQAIVELVGNTRQTIDYDIKNATTFPEPYMFALFASKAYENTEKEMLPLPDGWKLIATAVNGSWTNGYFGAAFMHPEQFQVVIAHRGTANLGAFVADVQGSYNRNAIALKLLFNAIY